MASVKVIVPWAQIESAQAKSMIFRAARAEFGSGFSLEFRPGGWIVIDHEKNVYEVMDIEDGFDFLPQED